MHVVFDNLSTQVQVHRRLHINLNTLLSAIRSEGWTHTFARDPITPDQRHGCNVLAIPHASQRQKPLGRGTP